MQAIVVRELGPLESLDDRMPVGLGETKRLEIRETPIRLAQGRLHRDGAPVGGNAVLLTTRRLQAMAIAHPDLRLVRMLRQCRLVDLDRIGGVAQIGEY